MKDHRSQWSELERISCTRIFAFGWAKKEVEEVALNPRISCVLLFMSLDGCWHHSTLGFHRVNLSFHWTSATSMPLFAGKTTPHLQPLPLCNTHLAIWSETGSDVGIIEHVIGSWKKDYRLGSICLIKLAVSSPPMVMQTLKLHTTSKEVIVSLLTDTILVFPSKKVLLKTTVAEIHMFLGWCNPGVEPI